MKYFIAIFVTAVLIFLGATVYYKGLPSFPSPSGISVSTKETPSTFPASPSPSSTPADESVALVADIKAALIAEHSSAGTPDVTVSKIEGDFAKGEVSFESGGGIWFGAKVNGIWKLIWDGNGIITCADVAPYPALPKDLLPQCYDTATESLINR